MSIYGKILELEDKNLPGVLVTVIEKEGHGPQVPGAKMLISEGERISGTIGGGAIEYSALKEYTKVIDAQSSYTKKYLLDEDSRLVDHEKTGMICGGKITLFFEILKAKPVVYIFGAGHIGKVLARFLSEIGFNIIMLDCRKDIESEIDCVDKFINDDYISAIDSCIDFDNSFIVILTHSHEFDYKVLKKIYEKAARAKYIGLIASKKKSAKTVERLCSELEFKPDLKKLYTPIGLKLGGNSPAEIALSIASEIQAVNNSVTALKHATGNWIE